MSVVSSPICVSTAMMYEIELYFQGNEHTEPYMTVTVVAALCATELMETAHRMRREQKASHVSFGPAIERDADGQPLVLAAQKRK